MKHVLIRLIPVVMLTGALNALSSHRISDVMHQKIHAIENILQNASLPQEAKKKRIIALVEGVFDYRAMAKIALGKRWRTLSKTQQKRFLSRFTKRLERSYFDKLKYYNNETITLKGTTKPRAKRIFLHTDIAGKDSRHRVVYKFYQVGNQDDWRIYDVSIDGVSLMQTYRKQFADALKRQDIEALIASL